jgi:FtsH-binding integral membrane protein
VASLRALMRVFSYFYHLLLTLFLLAISVVAIASGQTLHLGMLPWTGRSLTWWLFFSGLGGLIFVILAIRQTARGLFFLWSLAVLVMMVRGFFFSSYYFHGRPEFYRALYLTIGAFIAVPGAWFVLRREPRKRYK